MCKKPYYILKFRFSEKATKFEKIFVVLLTRSSCSMPATAYLSKSRRRFLKTNVDNSYYTNFTKNLSFSLFLINKISSLKSKYNHLTVLSVQGAEVISGIQRLSISWKNHCWYWNKRYISRKPCISALIWHPKNGRGTIRRAPRPLAAKSIFWWILWPRGGFLTFWILWPL